MPDTYAKEGGGLIVRFNGECIAIEPWGADALRIRARIRQNLCRNTVEAALPSARELAPMSRHMT